MRRSNRTIAESVNVVSSAETCAATAAFLRRSPKSLSYVTDATAPFGETFVIKSLNLDIERGEFLTMLGPSGSGKTTCLMMLAGFETATHGEI